MDFTLKPSLQHFCAVKIAIELWKSNDVRNKLKRFVEIYDATNLSTVCNLANPLVLENRRLGREILEITLTKIDQFPLSETAKSEVRGVLRPIGNEIFIAYNEIFFAEETKLSFDYYVDHLSWTPWGRIDRPKTVESYLENDQWSILQRYFWACTYSCAGERNNANVWKKCAQEMDRYVIERDTSHLGIGYGYFEHVDNWKLRKSFLTELMTLMNAKFPCQKPRKCVTEVVIGEANDATFQQFWESSSDEMKNIVLRKILNATFEVPVCCSEVLFFLISQLNHQQRTSFFLRNGYVIWFHILRNWPRRKFLLPNVTKSMKRFLTKLNFCKLVVFAGELGFVGFPQTDEAQMLLDKLWVDSPNEWKRYAIKSNYNLILTLILSVDGKSMKLVVEAADGVLRRKIYGVVTNVLSAFPRYICVENWDSIVDFLRDVSFNKNEIEDFKTDVLFRNDYELCRKLIMESEWQSLDKLVNWALICEDEGKNFKQQLAYSKGAAICQLWILENDLMAVDKFTNWCFNSHVARSRFKGRILSREIKMFLSSDALEIAEELMFRSYTKDNEKLRLLEN